VKRSEINALLKDAEDFFALHRFLLPPWAHWAVEEWKNFGEGSREVVENHLGWDITDFGSGDFSKRGLLLFTLRNGQPDGQSKSYAEKIMIVGPGQETPTHFHFRKVEDIINRGGGNLVLQLWNSEADEGLAETPVLVATDGFVRTLPPGGKVTLGPGESICLPRRLYHRFFGQGERVLVGEVSSVNDDLTDNRFLENAGRFPEIEENEPPWRLLVSDYLSYLDSSDSFRIVGEVGLHQKDIVS
jgi:D-lyxose ketol-isomerase